MSAKKRVIVLALGCPENRIDSATILEIYKENGYVDTTDIKLADMGAANTCALTTIAEGRFLNAIKRKPYRVIRKLHTRWPWSRI